MGRDGNFELKKLNEEKEQPGGVNAVFCYNNSNDDVDDNFFYLSEEHQARGILHELLTGCLHGRWKEKEEKRWWNKI